MIREIPQTFDYFKTIRIGYLASTNSDLIEQIVSLGKIIDVQGDSLMEQAVLQLIKDSTVKRRIKKASNHYKAKRDLITSLLKEYLKDKATYTIPEWRFGVLGCS